MSTAPAPHVPSGFFPDHADQHHAAGKAANRPAIIATAPTDLGRGDGAPDVSRAGGKFLTFQLGNESFALPVAQVREIIRCVAISALPQMPAHVRGVINLRGRIIPIIDLGVRFGLERTGTADNRCIVVVSVSLRPPATVHLGLIVDEVEEVLNIAASQIEPPPDFGCATDTDFIHGIAKLEDSVRTLLDINRILAPEELREVSRAHGTS